MASVLDYRDGRGRGRESARCRALGIVESIEALERELGRPVISVNVATYWRCLRTLGIDDALTGFGRLARMP